VVHREARPGLEAKKKNGMSVVVAQGMRYFRVAMRNGKTAFLAFCFLHYHMIHLIRLPWSPFPVFAIHAKNRHKPPKHGKPQMLATARDSLFRYVSYFETLFAVSRPHRQSWSVVRAQVTAVYVNTFRFLTLQ
jgi:hypothetical protein